MTRIFKTLLFATLLVLTALLSSQCLLNEVKDSCNDRGGAWNDELLRCDGIDGRHPGDCFEIHPCIITGKYVTISESESNVSIMIYPENMGARIDIARWDVGKHAELKSNWAYASWLCNGKEFIITQQNGITTTMRYDPALSLAGIGKEGTAPGIIFVSSSDLDDPLTGLMLWREESM